MNEATLSQGTVLKEKEEKMVWKSGTLWLAQPAHNGLGAPTYLKEKLPASILLEKGLAVFGSLDSWYIATSRQGQLLPGHFETVAQAKAVAENIEDLVDWRGLSLHELIALIEHLGYWTHWETKTPQEVKNLSAWDKIKMLIHLSPDWDENLFGPKLGKHVRAGSLHDN